MKDNYGSCQVKSKTRFVRLENITLPVRVEHAHLAAHARIDELDSRIDMLRITATIEYDGGNFLIKDRSMEGAWNYGPLYQHLCVGDVQTITGPLESVLDSAALTIERSVAQQGFVLQHSSVFADRLGLAVGYPRLGVVRGRSATPNESEHIRYAGICDFPLVTTIDHSWCVDDQMVEHQAVRHEAVKVSFGAYTRSGPLSLSDLKGLYNYAALLHQIEALQGLCITGPTEQLVDVIESKLVEDATREKIDLVATRVEVSRTGYARCTPVIGAISRF